MGHKIHPTGFRLGVVQEHRSRWFAEGMRYPELLQEDHRIREYVQKTLNFYECIILQCSILALANLCEGKKFQLSR